MNKIFSFIKQHFLTKKFLTFGIIGVLNTLIHLAVYNAVYSNIGLNENILAFLANSIAFITASVFSYFANAFFTFKPKNRTAIQFSLVMVVFVLRLLISSSLTTFFNFVFIEWFKFDYEAYHILSLIPPFLASALLIPIAYFALDKVFKKTDIQKV